MLALDTLRRLNDRAATSVRSEPPALYTIPGRPAPPADDDAVIEAALAILKARHAPGTVLATPADSVRYLGLVLAPRAREVFAVLFLDNRHRVLAFEELFAGTIDGASVHPREVVRRALHWNAAAVVLAHNHPSGDPQPSLADEHITRRLRDALALIDVRVLDHIVVGAEGAVSLAERGML